MILLPQSTGIDPPGARPDGRLQSLKRLSKTLSAPPVAGQMKRASELCNSSVFPPHSEAAGPTGIFLPFTPPRASLPGLIPLEETPPRPSRMASEEAARSHSQNLPYASIPPCRGDVNTRRHWIDVGAPSHHEGKGTQRHPRSGRSDPRGSRRDGVLWPRPRASDREAHDSASPYLLAAAESLRRPSRPCCSPIRPIRLVR